MDNASESSVAALLHDISNKSNLYATLHEFSQRLTRMHKDFVKMEGEYRITPGQADKITAEYCESFIYTILKTLEAKRRAEGKGGFMTDKEELREKILGVLIDEYKQNCNYDALMKIMHLIDAQTTKLEKELDFYRDLKVVEGGLQERKVPARLVWQRLQAQLSKDKDNHGD